MPNSSSGRHAGMAVEVLSSKFEIGPPIEYYVEGREEKEQVETVDLFEVLESRAVWKIEELGELLAVSPKTLYKQACRNKIPAFKIGTCVRVYGRAFADYLRNKMK